VPSAAHHRAARAFPWIRAWALVQRARAVDRGGADAPRAAADAPLDAPCAAAARTGCSSREALRRLMGQPVVGVLARVLSFITGDAYRVLEASAR